MLNNDWHKKHITTDVLGLIIKKHYCGNRKHCYCAKMEGIL